MNTDQSANIIAAFKGQTIQQRFQIAHDMFGQELVLLTSFGASSIILLQELHQSGLHIRILNVSIRDEKYKKASQYRDKLTKNFNLQSKLNIYDAANDLEKVAVTRYALRNMRAKAVLSGIRGDTEQTELRQNKRFAELRDGVHWLHPILDWSKDNADDYVEKVSLSLRFDGWSRDLKTQGGAEVTVKAECGIHNNPNRAAYYRDRGLDV